MGTKSVIELTNPGIPVPASDALTDVLREGARRMLREAVDSPCAFERPEQSSAGGAERLSAGTDDPDRAGGRRRHGAPCAGPGGSDPVLVPDPSAHLRRTKSLAELLPWLYLRGISTGDFSSLLTSLLGQDAPGLSAATIQRLKESWKEDHRQWATRDLPNTYVYLWADGIHFNVRMDEANQCVLVVIGATADGKKELLAIQDGYRESEQSWKELLLDLKHRGLSVDPKLAIGDGALGFWKALPQVFGATRGQRCWVHKTANVLNKLPKANQPKAKSALHQIWMADTKHAAHTAVDVFISTYAAKYLKATACLAKDREALLAFYDSPAEHWVHTRTTNPIESTFATVRHRTVKTRECVSRESMLSMVFKLTVVAEQRWRRLKGSERVGEVLRGMVFRDGVTEEEQERAA